MWDAGAAGDYDLMNSEETNSDRDIEGREANEAGRDAISQNQSQSESGIDKSLHFLEEYSLIDFLDTDGEFIITAGGDHDIKVWDVDSEVAIQRLIGHSGPITGLKLQSVGTSEAGLVDRLVISASKDGSIRGWSIRKGVEIMNIETENVITCMDVLTNKLAATGNHKGHLEIHHLSTGQLYSSAVAHADPIDALMVNDVFICTAVFDRPGKLRVWQLKWGKIICMYSLDDVFSIEFSSFTMYGDLLILGDANEQKVHILCYSSDDKDNLNLSDNSGCVQHIAVMENLILASTVNNNKEVYLHVYQLHDFDHLGSFHCKHMDRISSVSLIRSDTMLKFILGGSALAVLKLEFFETNDNKELPVSCNSTKQAEMDPKINGSCLTDYNKNDDNQYMKHNLVRDLFNAKLTGKNQNTESNQSVYYCKELSTIEGLPLLPPIKNSKESNPNVDMENQKHEHLDSEQQDKTFKYNKDNQTVNFIPLKGNLQKREELESLISLEDLNGSTDSSTTKHESYARQVIEAEEVKPFCECENRTQSIKQPPPEDEYSILSSEISKNNGMEKKSSPRTPRTPSQKQIYKSENVRIIEIDKQHERGGKRNWFQLIKKRQPKNTEKAQQKKKKEKDCKIM